MICFWQSARRRSALYGLLLSVITFAVVATSYTLHSRMLHNEWLEHDQKPYPQR